MTEPTCTALRRRDGGEPEPCGRPTPDAFLCRGCTSALTKLLAELPSWLAELETAIARQSRTSRPGGGKPTKRAEQPLPFDTGAAELMQTVRNELTTAIRGLCADRGIEPPRIERTADMAVWLVAHVESLRQQVEAPELLTWARSLRDALRWRVDNLGTRFAGPCRAGVQLLEVGSDADPRPLSATGSDERAASGHGLGRDDSEAAESRSALPVRVVERECGADLRMRSGDATIRCKACGTVHDAADVLADVIQRNHDHMGTAADLSDMLTTAGWPVKAATIRKWAERGKLYDWREDGLGCKLYRVGDVLDLIVAAATREVPA